jgi:putative inorganic carbon (HCO3(-)) transporter
MVENGRKIVHFCDLIMEWSFCVLLAGVTFSVSLVEIVTTLMIVAWLVKRAVDRDLSSLRDVSFVLLLAFWGWVVLSCFNSQYAKESFRGIMKVLQYSMMFVVAATELRSGRFLKRIVPVMAMVAVLIGVNGIYQYFSGVDFLRHRELMTNDYLRRISSSFVHPNDFGVYLVVILSVFISFIGSEFAGTKARLLVFAVALLAAVNLVLTGSRGAWISFALAFLVIGAMRTRKILALFIVGLVIIFALLPASIKTRIVSLGDMKEGTSWERVMLWEGTINMIEARPLLGFGVNTYSRNFPAYKPAEYPDHRYSHNCYLQMASEIGIPGALLFIAFLLSVLVKSILRFRSMAPGINRDLLAGFIAGAAGFLLNSAVDTHLYSVDLAVFINMMLGLCFAISLGPYAKRVQ